MFPALAIFANHPQSSGMFLSVTTWIEQSASNVFYSTLRRLGKLPELLAGFARPPMLSHIFPYLSHCTQVFALQHLYAIFSAFAGNGIFGPLHPHPAVRFLLAASTEKKFFYTQKVEKLFLCATLSS